MIIFADEIKFFIKSTSWIFAKTYAKTWPHKYIVQEKVDNDLLSELAKHIDTFGHEEYFYKKKMTYFDIDRFANFTKVIGKGLTVEIKETIEILSLIRIGESIKKQAFKL